MKYLIIHISSLGPAVFAASVAQQILEKEQDAEVWLLVQEPELFRPFFPKIHFIKKQQTVALQTKALREMALDEVIVADTSKRAALLGKAAKAKRKSIFQANPLKALFKSVIPSSEQPRPEDFFGIRESLDVITAEETVPPKGDIILAPFPEIRRRVDWEQWRKITQLLPAGLKIKVLAPNNRIARHFDEEVEIIAPDQFRAYLQESKLVISSHNVFGLLAGQSGKPTVLFSEQPMPFVTTVSNSGWHSAIAAAAVTSFSDEGKFNYAVQLLRQGRIILHETDTIPGLAAKATDEAAIDRLFSIKERDPSKSLIILCRDVRMVEQYVRDIPGVAFKLWDKAGDAPLTLILPASKGLPSSVVAADHSVAVRIPQNKFLQYMIHQVGGPIASTSANLSGRPSPSNLSDLDPELVQRVDFLLDIAIKDTEKEKSPAQASTIIKISREGSCDIIRKGTLNQELSNFLDTLPAS